MNPWLVLVHPVPEHGLGMDGREIEVVSPWGVAPASHLNSTCNCLLRAHPSIGLHGTNIPLKIQSLVYVNPAHSQT